MIFETSDGFCLSKFNDREFNIINNFIYRVNGFGTAAVRSNRYVIEEKHVSKYHFKNTLVK